MFGISRGTDSKSEHNAKGVLPDKYSAGPHGVGDPDDKTLRKVEIEILIPKKMREKSRAEKCPELVKAFGDCCLANGASMIVLCRKENAALKECLTKWYQNEEFKQICTEEYLRERSEYRRSGIKKSYRKKESTTF
uniref:COX assembly mitochondrial protein n=1 Tax=Strigamia maritima TaxID=126957 RepID=T1JIQ4_STRMM